MWEDDCPEELEGRIGYATGCPLDLCKQHLLSPNLARGKTDILLVFTGRRSRAFREKHYGSNAPGTFPIICEEGVQQIQIIKSYSNILAVGFTIVLTNEWRWPSKKQLPIRPAAFSRHRKILYANKNLEFVKRTELFSTLVLNKFLRSFRTSESARAFEKDQIALSCCFSDMWS